MGRIKSHAGRRTSANNCQRAHSRCCTQRYSVGYDDGDTETNVTPNNIRRMRSSRSATFRQNQRVEANYQGLGRWYPGVVTAVVSPCCYNIRYNDGDTENCVDPLKIRTVQRRTCTDSAGRRCVAGFRMQGNWRGYGRYYPGTVTSCRNGVFSLSYDDGSRETNVLGDKIRNCAAARCNRRSLTQRVGASVTANWKGRGRYFQGVITAINTSTCKYTITYCDGDREVAVPPNRVRASRTMCSCVRSWYTIGQTVTANWNNRGRWFNAKICGCSSRTLYKICYDDGDKEASVPVSRIRNRRG